MSTALLQHQQALSVLFSYLIRSRNPPFTKFLVGLLLSYPDDCLNQHEQFLVLFSPSGLKGRTVKENLQTCEAAIGLLFLRD